MAGQMESAQFPRIVAIALAACGTLAFPPLSHAIHGRTVGTAGVTSIGTATYSIPLDLPRGTNELTPQLTITYDHRTGASPLGLGWNLSGLSAIARCESTKAQDGAPRNVRLDYNDQYCLDDQKLRLETGTHGQPGAQYRTEVESFARVTAYGTAGFGPAYFFVERKDGLIYEYGNTADSRIESLGLATPRVWALNKIRDRSGNAITFVYTEDSTNGSYRISSIDYATNLDEGVTTPPYHVNFVYETLPVGEVSSRYLSGKLIKRLTRLDRIEIRHETTIVRQYELSYEPNLSNTARSRLQSIQECANDLDTCYSPTTFTYQNGIPIYQGPGAAPGSIPTANILVIDINGDARSDLVYPSSATSGAGTWMYMLASTAGGFDNPINSGIANTNFTQAIPIDYNADGLEDFLVPYSGGTWWVVLGSSSGLTAPFNTNIPAAGGPGNARAMDVTADGLEDLVWAEFDGMGGDAVYYRARELNGTFSSTPGYLVGPVGLDGYLENPVFADSLFSSRDRHPDFNGDGYADFVAKFRFYNPEVGPMQRWTEVVLGGGAGRFEIANTPSATVMYPVDLNGDGFTDLAYVLNGNWTYRFSQGTSFGPNVTGPSAANYLAQNAVVVDYEGDGYEDLVARYTGNNYLGYLRSTGESLLPPAMITASFNNATHHYVGDVNGDGQSDILALAGSTLHYQLHAGPAPDLLLSVTDGFGNQVSFDYKPLTSTNGCYSRDSAAPAFPSKAYVGSVQVVCSMTTSDGIGGSYSLSYHYSNADMHLQGRGFLGFGKRRVVDSRNDIAEFEEYSTDYAAYERLGALLKKTVRQSTSGPVIRETTPTWNRHIYGSGTRERRFPYVSHSVTLEREVGGSFNGALLRTVTTTNSVHSTTGTLYDSTTTTVEATTANGVQASASYSQRVHLPTANLLTDTANWCLGRPQRVETTGSHNQFGGGAITRSLAVSWDAAKCRPAEIVIEPGQGALQVTRALEYDNFGNLNADTVIGAGMAARATTFQWDAAGRFPESVTNALSQTTSFDWYETTGLPRSQTDPNGLTVSWQYDAMGRRTRETRPDGTKTTWTYEICAGCANSNGRTLVTERHLDANDAVITDRRFYADTLDRQIAVSERSLSGAYTRVERKYDSLGRIIQAGAPCWWSGCTQYWTDIAYDSLNRPISVSRPLSDSILTPQTTHIYYEGLTTRRVDALGKETKHIVNATGALARSADHTGYYQQFDYDGFGNALRVVDSLGLTLVSNVFNVRGMRTQQTELSSTGAFTYTPNALGEVISQTDAKGQTATFEYDLLGRLKKRIEPEGTSEWIWGNSASAKNIGQLAAMTGPGYSESYLYDAVGRMQTTTIVSDATYHVDYAYNASGMLHTLTYPASTAGYRLQLLYEYQNGHLLSVKDANAPSTAFWTAGATDAQGNIIAEALGNGIQTIRGYDSVTGLLDYIDSGSGAIQNLSYAWDAVGNLTDRRDERQGLSEGFQYDDLHRLTATTGADPISLDYDPRGNLISKIGNANNVHSGVSHTITYTSYNLPNTISRPGGDASQFFYAPDRSRWKQAATYGGTAETTVYIGNLIEKVTVGTNVLWRHYIAGATGPVAVYTRKSSGTNEIHYLTRDHLGSVDSFTNAAGTVVLRTAFGAFGQRRKESGWSGDLTSADWTGVASTTRRGYTFHETLDNLNLTHMNGRVYDQLTGSFLSPDPLVQAPGLTQSFNRYAYVFNSPLSYTDPSGYAADAATAASTSNPLLWLVQFVRIWGGDGLSPGDELRLAYLQELAKYVPPFDPVQRPRTAHTDAGEPVKNDPAASFKGSTVGGTATALRGSPCQRSHCGAVSPICSDKLQRF